MAPNRMIWILTGVFVLACTAAQAQVSDARIHELIRQAAEKVSQTDASVQPPVAGAAAQARPVVRLTLDEAVKLTLDRNLDIAVQRLNPEINDIAIASVRSVYSPTLTSTIGPQSVTQLPTSALQLGNNGTATINDTMTFNGGIAQSVPWGGGSFSLALNNFKRTTTSNNALFNPQFQSVWSGIYTQPLLRGFSTDATRQQSLGAATS